jgi:hypothetical protein
VPSTYIKAAQIVQAAALLLQREIVLPATRVDPARRQLPGALNDTVTLKVPAVLASRTRTLRASAAGGRHPDRDQRPGRPRQHVYSLLNITDEELTLDIADFAAQVLAPQMRAVAEGMENSIVDALENATSRRRHDQPQRLHRPVRDPHRGQPDAQRQQRAPHRARRSSADPTSRRRCSTATSS